MTDTYFNSTRAAVARMGLDPDGEVPEPDAVAPDPVSLTYTNYRGETSARRIRPLRLWYGATEWHPEPQWLIEAEDADKGERRDFALRDFSAKSDAARIAALEAERRETAGLLRRAVNMATFYGEPIMAAQLRAHADKLEGKG